MQYGRPMKNKTRRIPITVHIPVGTLGIIDTYVQREAEARGTVYSRSDFYNDAVEAFLKSKGVTVDGEEDTSVTKP